jgi:hypothetical protein
LRQAHTEYFRGVSQVDHDGHRAPVDVRNPLEELIAIEDEAARAAAMESLAVAQRVLDLQVIPEALAEQVREMAFEQFRCYQDALVELLFEEGPHPLAVMKRVFAFVKHYRASLVWNMSFRNLGDLFAETHAAAHARSRAMFGETPAGWRKTREARANMRAAQRGNCNRRGGKKVRAKKSPTLKSKKP